MNEPFRHRVIVSYVPTDVVQSRSPLAAVHVPKPVVVAGDLLKSICIVPVIVHCPRWVVSPAALMVR